jgi:hypothetical protein
MRKYGPIYGSVCSLLLVVCQNRRVQRVQASRSKPLQSTRVETQIANRIPHSRPVWSSQAQRQTLITADHSSLGSCTTR